jgi:phosphatidylserine decarboxylase
LEVPEIKLHQKCRIASGARKFYAGGVKHSGKAAWSALKLVGIGFAALIVVLAGSYLAEHVGAFVLHYLAWVFISLWTLFVGFTVYFFRDPDPMTPTGKNLVVAPGHGTVDVIDMAAEPDFIGGECRRVSIFLSVFDVHVQNAPVTGRVALFKHTPGQYLNAMRTDSAKFNENVLIGLEAAEPAGEKIGVRLIAGLIARRIVPWAAQNDAVQRGERISLIQFGSRVDVYLPLLAKIRVKLGDKVRGGETVIASFD